MFRFANPWMLLGLVIVLAYLYLELKLRKAEKPRFPFARFAMLKAVAGSKRWLSLMLPLMHCLLLCLLVVALARPQWGRGIRDMNQQGVDIVISIDVSGSMLAMDFAPDSRLDASVKVAQDFVKNRPNDRFSLVAFSEYAITQSPLTFDHNAVLTQLDRLEVNTVASGTAIGMGLAKGVGRLRDSKAKSKVIVLITDGVNNYGEIDPISAARMANALGIRVYPIGVGSHGLVNFPYNHPIFGIQYQKVQIELDMDTLDRIADITGTGKAALVSDGRQFAEIMKQIDQMEKTEYRVKLQYEWNERFPLFLWLAFFVLLLSLSLKLWLLPVLPD